MSRPLPVTLVGGFLGAGKTTLVNQLLRQKRAENIGVVVNDFGPIDIDGDLIVGVEGEVLRLTNGCICCSLRQGLSDTIMRLVETQPDLVHLVVEASGASDPAALIAGLRELQGLGIIRFDGLVTVVDAAELQLDADDEIGRLQRSQVTSADLLVLNKTDLVDDAQAVVERLQGLKPDVRIVPTQMAEVPFEVLLGLASSDEEQPPATGHPSFSTFVWTRCAPVPFRPLFDRLQSLPASVLRAKGLLNLQERPGQRVAAHLVGRRLWAQPVGGWKEAPITRLVFIGLFGPEQEAEIRARLEELA